MRSSFCVLSLAFILGVFGAFAQDEEPSPKELLAQGMRHLDGLDAMSVLVDMNLEANIQGQQNSMNTKAHILHRGAEDLWLKLNGPEFEVQLFSNESGYHVYLVDEQEYIVHEQPAPRMQLTAYMGGGPLGFASVWAAQFLNNDPTLIEEMTKAEYVAGEDGENATRTIAITTGEYLGRVVMQLDPPLPREVRLDLSPYMKSQDMDQGSLEINMRFTDWEMNPETEDAQFAFVPPEGVKEMAPPENPREPPAEPLLGKDAPNLQLNLLDGGKMNLADHKGKHVVVLDFWATWCGPCRVSMPILESVAKDYASKGVVVYAVNLREEKEKITAFLERNPVDLTIALDPEGVSGKKYEIQGIPRMVIVGKDGVVRAGHSGVSPALDQEVRSELDALLAGEGAAEDEAAK